MKLQDPIKGISTRLIRLLLCLFIGLPFSDLRAELAGLAVTDGTLAPAFSTPVTSYGASVPFRTTGISVIPVEAGPGSSIRVRLNGGSWTSVASAATSPPLALAVGANAVEVESTDAESEVTLYEIEVNRAAEEDDPVYRYDFNSDGVLPNLTIYNNTGQPNSNFYTVSGGVLQQDTSTVNGNISFLFPDVSSKGGGFSQAKATYAEAKLKITSASGNSGIYFAIYDGGRSYTANFSATGVTVGSTFVPLEDLDEFHTYRLESPPNSSMLYLFRDGVLTFATTADSAPYNGFGWGDGLSSGGNHGVADWDYIEFGQLSSNTGATGSFRLRNTGVDNNGSILAGGAPDNHFAIVSPAQAAVVMNPVDIPGSYIPESTDSRWIWQQADGQPTDVTRVFRTQFDLSGFNPETALIEGRWATDNQGLDVLLNGISLGITSFGFSGWSHFFISTGFRKGINTLDFVVNDYGAIAGFRAEFLRHEAELVRGTTAIELDALVHLNDAPMSLELAAGSYRIRHNPNGTFIAWNPWSGSGNSHPGWMWSFGIRSPSVPVRLVSKTSNPGFFETPQEAFDDSITTFEFTLPFDQVVDFFIPDSVKFKSDNEGGISLLLQRLEDPSAAVATAKGPLSYRKFADSPFSSEGFIHFTNQTFEGPEAAVPGVSIFGSGSGGWSGSVSGPGGDTDSVDEDDGVIDEEGSGGHSLAIQAPGTLLPWTTTIRFSEVVLGYLPTHAGFVWTDGTPDGGVRVEFLDREENRVASIGPSKIGDEFSVSSTQDDYFLGAVYRGGIASIVITAPAGHSGMEIDHLQFGIGPDLSATQDPLAQPPGNPRIYVLHDRIIITPDDSTGSMAGAFRITEISGGTLTDPANGLTITTGTVIPISKGLDGLVWTPGTGQQRISVEAVAPRSSEASEVVTLDLSVTGSQPVFSFEKTNEKVVEGEVCRISVHLKGESLGGETVEYAIIPGSAVAFDGVDGDYSDSPSPLVFKPNPLIGGYEAVIKVPVIQDGIAENEEQFFVHLVNPSTSAALGRNSVVRILVEEKTLTAGDSTILNPLERADPFANPPGSGQIQASLNPAVPGAAWRLIGEPFWREPGSFTPPNALIKGYHRIDYKPVLGFDPPEMDLGGPGPFDDGPDPRFRKVEETGTVVILASYGFKGSSVTGTLSVEIHPDSIASAILEEDRGQWRMVGDQDWLDSGASRELPPGRHLIEFKDQIAGFAAPTPRSVVVTASQQTIKSSRYQALPAQGASLSVLPHQAGPDLPAANTSPYQYVGQIETAQGYGTGVAVTRHAVLTAARVVFDAENLAATTEVAWFHRRHARYGANSEDREIPAVKYPRGCILLTNYAAMRNMEATSETEAEMLGDLPSDQQDVAALFFSLEDKAGVIVASGGFSGFLADYNGRSGFNPWLLGDTTKTVVGYPMSSINGNDRGLMHGHEAQSFPMFLLGGNLYEADSVKGFPGCEGAPLFVRHANGYSYPAAVYLGNHGGAVFRGLDGFVAEMIYRAEAIGAGKAGNHRTGSEGQYVPRWSEEEDLTGYIVVDYEPGEARWRLVDAVDPTLALSGDWYAAGTRIAVPQGTYGIEYETLAGFTPPHARTVVAVAGITSAPPPAIYQVTYASWADGFPEFDLADPDASLNGLKNLLAFAFGLKPGQTDQLPALPLNPGLPRVEVDSSTMPATMKVEFLMRNGELTPGLEYSVEFSDSPAGPWAPLAEVPLAVSRINDQWSQASLSAAPQSPAGCKFTRVRVRFEPNAP